MVMAQNALSIPLLIFYVNALDPWYSNLSREIHFPVEFSSNPDQTHLAVIF